MEDLGQFSKAARLLVVAASFVVVIAGMKAAASIQTPVFLAVFIALLCLPAVRWLQTRRVPDAIGVPIVLGFAMLIGLVVLGVLSGSVRNLMADLPRYTELFNDKTTAVIHWAETTFNEDVSDDIENQIRGGLDASKVLGSKMQRGAR